MLTLRRDGVIYDARASASMRELSFNFAASTASKLTSNAGALPSVKSATIHRVQEILGLTNCQARPVARRQHFA